MEENQEQKISKYSSGVNILIRINNLWQKTHLFAEAGVYSHLNTVLDRIWLELARDLKDKDYTDEKKTFDAFDERLKELMPFNDEKPKGFKAPTSTEIENRNKIYTVLMDKQLYLSRLENKMGKGTTYDSGDESDWE